MVGKNKKRIYISLPKQTIANLEAFIKDFKKKMGHNCSKSDVICYLIDNFLEKSVDKL